MLRCLWLFWLGVGSLDGIDRDEWHCEQLAGACDVAGSGGIVEQPVVTDAVEPLRQDTVLASYAQLHALYAIRVIDGREFKVIDTRSAAPVDIDEMLRLAGAL